MKVANYTDNEGWPNYTDREGGKLEIKVANYTDNESGQLSG